MTGFLRLLMLFFALGYPSAQASEFSPMPAYFKCSKLLDDGRRTVLFITPLKDRAIAILTIDAGRLPKQSKLLGWEHPAQFTEHNIVFQTDRFEYEITIDGAILRMRGKNSNRPAMTQQCELHNADRRRF